MIGDREGGGVLYGNIVRFIGQTGDLKRAQTCGRASPKTNNAMMKRLLTAALVSACLVACSGGKTTPHQATDSLKAHLSAPAVYLGTLPAADCPGIEVSLTLEDSLRATYRSVYIGRDGDFTERGTYTIEGNRLTLALANDTLHFGIGTQSLSLLDQAGQKIAGAMAAHYVLHERQPYDYAGHYALSGEEVGGYRQTLSISPEGAHYRVAFDASLIKGSAGCSFGELASLERDTLFVHLPKPHEGMTMYIAPSHDQQGVEVFTTRLDDRFALMWYCSGGGSLAGTYQREDAGQ